MYDQTSKLYLQFHEKNICPTPFWLKSCYLAIKILTDIFRGFPDYFAPMATNALLTDPRAVPKAAKIVPA